MPARRVSRAFSVTSSQPRPELTRIRQLCACATQEIAAAALEVQQRPRLERGPWLEHMTECLAACSLQDAPAIDQVLSTVPATDTTVLVVDAATLVAASKLPFPNTYTQVWRAAPAVCHACNSHQAGRWIGQLCASLARCWTRYPRLPGAHLREFHAGLQAAIPWAPPRAMSGIAYLAAKLHQHEPSIAQAMLRDLLPYLARAAPSLPVPSLARYLHTYVAAEVDCPELEHAVLARLSADPDGWRATPNGRSAGSVSRLVSSLAAKRALTAATMATLAPALRTHCTAMNAQSVASVLWALAFASVTAEPSLLAALAERAAACLSSEAALDPASVAVLAWACGLLRVRNEQLWQRLDELAAVVAPRLAPAAAGQYLGALMQAQLAQSKGAAALAAAAAPGLGELPPAAVLAAVRAAHKFLTSDAALCSAAATVCWHWLHAEEPDLRAAFQLFRVLASAGWAPPPLAAAVADAVLGSTRHSAPAHAPTGADFAACAWALCVAQAPHLAAIRQALQLSARELSNSAEQRMAAYAVGTPLCHMHMARLWLTYVHGDRVAEHMLPDELRIAAHAAYQRVARPWPACASPLMRAMRTGSPPVPAYVRVLSVERDPGTGIPLQLGLQYASPHRAAPVRVALFVDEPAGAVGARRTRAPAPNTANPAAWLPQLPAAGLGQAPPPGRVAASPHFGPCANTAWSDDSEDSDSASSGAVSLPPPRAPEHAAAPSQAVAALLAKSAAAAPAHGGLPVGLRQVTAQLAGSRGRDERERAITDEGLSTESDSSWEMRGARSQQLPWLEQSAETLRAATPASAAGSAAPAWAAPAASAVSPLQAAERAVLAATGWRVISVPVRDAPGRALAGEHAAACEWIAAILPHE